MPSFLHFVRLPSSLVIHTTSHSLRSAIVFQRNRGFSPGEGGLAFLGIGLGILIGGALTPVQNALYRRAVAKSPGGVARPEFRLMLACVAAVLLPVGMFWFAWWVLSNFCDKIRSPEVQVVQDDESVDSLDCPNHRRGTIWCWNDPTLCTRRSLMNIVPLDCPNFLSPEKC